MAFLQSAANRGSVSTGGYEIDNSVKVENDNREYLRWTNFSSYASSARKKKFTMSVWLKRTEIGKQMMFWSTAANGYFSFDVGDTLVWYQQYVGSGTQLGLRTTRVFRDTSAWYHLMIVVDTAQSTEANRVKMYVNGVQETSFGNPNSYPSQNAEASNLYEQHLFLGEWGGGSTGFCGYLADYYFLSEIAASPTDLGEFDADTGIWKPIAYAGTISSPSHFLEFKDGSDLGTATSGLDSDYQNNLSAADQATDTPTNNFCTMNPLWTYTNAQVISEGGTKTLHNASTWAGAKASFGVTSGKWYWEYKTISGNGTDVIIGIQTDEGVALTGNAHNIISTAAWYIGGEFWIKDSTSGRDDTNVTINTTASHTDTYAFALDLDSSPQTISVYQNNALITNGGAINIDGLSDKTVFPFVACYSNNGITFNLGGYSVWTPSSPASDANGYGTFEYAPPSGYYAICTKNLAEYGG